jgi:hypothetical protein
MTTQSAESELVKCDYCNDDICPKCGGHMSYGIDCLQATMNPNIDYCECKE